MRNAIFFTLVMLPLTALLIYLLVLIIRALRKYIKSAPIREENRAVRGSLAEKLREVNSKISVEFIDPDTNPGFIDLTVSEIAKVKGVSRQAVSKWENGASDPSTANLIALAKLYGVSPEELLEGL